MKQDVTLFDVPSEKLKDVIQLIAALDLEGSKKKISSLLKLYPNHPDIQREADIVRFLEESIEKHTKPTELFNRFRAFKKFLQDIHYTPDYLDELREAYFAKIVDAYGSNPIEQIYGFPPGYLLMRAGRHDDARKSLVEEMESPAIPINKKARLLGYLGDLLFIIGDVTGARGQYVKAILTDWRGIDLKELADEDVMALVQGSYILEGVGEIWAASVGHMLMVFPPGEFPDADSVKVFYKEFSRLKSLQKKEVSEETNGKLFYYALIISENERLFSSFKGTGSMELRKLMRTLNPKLFRFYNKIHLKK
jgi:hypothetical protein